VVKHTSLSIQAFSFRKRKVLGSSKRKNFEDEFGIASL